MNQAIRVTDAPLPAGPYSQGITAGPFVFVAGQVGKNPESGQVPEGVEAQTHQTLRNVGAILHGAGCTMADVVKVTAHLSDQSYFDAFNRVYMEYFSEPLPVRTTVGSQLKNVLVEVDVIAYREKE